jgi:hypothetical protein
VGGLGPRAIEAGQRHGACRDTGEEQPHELEHVPRNDDQDGDEHDIGNGPEEPLAHGPQGVDQEGEQALGERPRPEEEAQGELAREIEQDQHDEQPDQVQHPVERGPPLCQPRGSLVAHACV